MDYTMIAIHTPGGRLPKPLDDYPNGIGGGTKYGVCVFVDGWRREEPFFVTEDQAEAQAVLEEHRARLTVKYVERMDEDE